MSYQYKGDFIGTALASLAASTTATNGTEFDSSELSVPRDILSALLSVTFTRASGSASLTVDFYFQVSADNGSTWQTYAATLSVLTGETAVTGNIVRYAFPVNLPGITHIRLLKIVNNDSGNALTDLNASISF